MVLTEEVKGTLKEKFKAIFEYNKMIESHNEEIKQLNESIKETFKSISKDMEIDEKDKDGLKGIKDAYKEYIKEIENPSWADSKNEAYALINNNDFLGLNSMRDEN